MSPGAPGRPPRDEATTAIVLCPCPPLTHVTSSTASTAPRSAPVSWSTSLPGCRVPDHPGIPTDPRRADEADILAVRLACGTQALATRLGPHLVLGQLPKGRGNGQLVLAEHGQHVDWSLSASAPGTAGTGLGVSVRRACGRWPRHRSPGRRPAPAIGRTSRGGCTHARFGVRPSAWPGRRGPPPVAERGGEVEHMVDQSELVGHATASSTSAPSSTPSPRPRPEFEVAPTT